MKKEIKHIKKYFDSWRKVRYSPDIRDFDFKLLKEIEDCQGADTHTWVSQQTLADRLHKSREYVNRRIRFLKAKKLLRVLGKRHKKTLKLALKCDLQFTLYVTPRSQDVLTPGHTTVTHIPKPKTIRVDKQPKRKKVSSKGKRKGVKFPAKDYTRILGEYQRLKEMKLQGSEYQPVKQTIKTMFMDGRSVEQILAVMRYVAELDYSDWTIRTVKMKLPEVLPKIGFQKGKPIKDDLTRKLAEIHKGGEESG